MTEGAASKTGREAVRAPLPPGPSIKDLPGFLWGMKRDQLGWLARAAREHGDVVKLPFGKPPTYLLAGPQEIGRVHLRTGKEFDKGYDDDPFLGNGLVNSEGEFWRRQRRLVQPAFHRERINAYAETMVSRTERMLKRWRETARETQLDAHAEMMHLTLGIVVETLFDAEVEDEADAVGKAIVAGTEEASRDMRRVVRLPEWVPTPGRRRTRRAVEELDRVVLGMIAARRAEVEKGEDRGDLLSMLLAARDEDGVGMPDRQLRDETMTLFLAGHETTASALTWAWVLLAENPGARRALHREIGEALGGRRPGVEDVPRLRYTGAVVKEAMRLYPPVPMVARRAAEETEVGGYRVPVGTQLLMSPWVVQRDRRFFPEPERFEPSRWLDGSADGLPDYAYFPFGGGPRKCIGTTFATIEAVLILATVEVRVDGPIATDASAFAVRPRHGVPFWAVARDGRA